MTVRVERSFELDASPEDVWTAIANPETRARAISVVSSYDLEDEAGRIATWQVELPIPFVRQTVPVRTEDVVRRPPRYVEFIGRSKVMDVRGEHELTETPTGCRLDNRFVVDGIVPGVERFFERNLNDELENLRRALERDLRPAHSDRGPTSTEGGPGNGSASEDEDESGDVDESGDDSE